MNVLSLFDGKACGLESLKRAGHKVDNYIASEIDKPAISIAAKNHPEIIHVGDVRFVHVTNHGIEIDLPGGQVRCIGMLPDLILAGSPCQGFSRAGLGLNFEDERSKLFFEFVRIYNEACLCAEAHGNPKPKFLLENVDMVQEWQDEISKLVGINPININSTLVSAQNRVRLYWCNFGIQSDMFGNSLPGIPQPKDRGIILNHVLQDESEVAEKFYLSDIASDRIRVKRKKPISPDSDIIVHSGYARTGGNKQGGTGLLSREDGKTFCLDTNPSNNRVERIGGVIDHHVFKENREGKANMVGHNYYKGPDNHGQRTVIQINDSTESGGAQPYQQNRIYDPKGKSPALLSEMSSGTHAIKVGSLYDNDGEAGRVYSSEGKARTLKDGGGMGSKTGLYEVKYRIRRLTPIECERLQGLSNIEIKLQFELCLDQVKNFVDAVEQSPKLLKLALSADQKESNILVMNAVKNSLINYQQNVNSVPINADIKDQEETLIILKKDSNINVKSAEKIVQDIKTENSADLNVHINIEEGKIINLGKEELHRNVNPYKTYLNGNEPLNLSGNEIMQLVKDVETSLHTLKTKNSTYTTLSRLSLRSSELSLVTLFWFAKAVINGYTQKQMSIRNIFLSLNISEGYTYSVSDTQRYKMIGNGWNIETIVHILKYLNS